MAERSSARATAHASASAPARPCPHPPTSQPPLSPCASRTGRSRCATTAGIDPGAGSAEASASGDECSFSMRARRLDNTIGRQPNSARRYALMDTGPIDSLEKPLLRRQAYALNFRTTNAPRPRARAVRKIRYSVRYLRAFTAAIVADPGSVWRKTERTIIWGKIRRTIIGCIPGLALRLKRKHGLTGGCISCGTSCNLLFQCPHWDAKSRLCSIYEDRPITCRLFPITPSDIADRNLASNGSACGYRFVPEDSRRDRARESGNVVIVVRQPTAGHEDPRQMHATRPTVQSVDAADQRRKSVGLR